MGRLVGYLIPFIPYAAFLCTVWPYSFSTYVRLLQPTLPLYYLGFLLFLAYLALPRLLIIQRLSSAFGSRFKLGGAG